MTPSRPYLIRALYEWIADNGCTPNIMVDANSPNTVVPQKYVQNGTITLNISQEATQNLRIGNDAIELQARFDAKVSNIYIPMPAVTAMFAAETNQGMRFSEQDIANYAKESGKSSDDTDLIPTKKPKLKVVD